MLQCGDPSGTGTGGPGYTIPDELTGKETYGPGTLAMANTGQPDTGGSQFFIVYRDTPLPPTYTVFGQVDAAGVKAVQKMAKQGTDNAFGQGDGHPKVAVTIDTVTDELSIRRDRLSPAGSRSTYRPGGYGRPCTTGRPSAGSPAAAPRGPGPPPPPPGTGWTP